MEKILAKVGALTVTEREVDEFLAELGQRGAGYNTPEGREMILEQLIADKLLLQEARRNLYEAEPEFRAELAKLKDNLLIRYAGNKALGNISASDKEVREFYDANPDKFIGQATVNASHILVDTEDLAKEILAKIKSGDVTFEDAAREYSSCPSKEEGGCLGDFGKGQMVPEFDAAVFAMEVGEVTETPLQTQFGFHLIKLNSKQDGELVPFDAIAPKIKEMLTSEKVRAAYDSKINQLKIMFPVDKM